MVLKSRPDNTEKSFKCSECGMMFSVDAHSTTQCPFCSHVCQQGECEIVNSSNEDY